MCTLHQHKDALQEILLQDAVLYVISVMLDAERQQLEDQSEQLHRLVVFVHWLITDRVQQKWRCKRNENRLETDATGEGQQARVTH